MICELKNRAKSAGKTLQQYVLEAVRLQGTYDKRVKERVQEAKDFRKEMGAEPYKTEELDRLVKAIMENEEKERVTQEALAKIKEEGEVPQFESDEDYFRFMESQGKLKPLTEYRYTPTRM